MRGFPSFGAYCCLAFASALSGVWLILFRGRVEAAAFLHPPAQDMDMGGVEGEVA
jgi:hypothetical protein